MMTYNYNEAVKDDIINYINENMDFSDYTTIDELEDALHDAELINEDSITGNGSGSYTFSRYEAGENLIGNFDLLEEALNHFGCTFEGDEESCDVLIRCYLVDDCIHEAIEEIEEEYNEFWEKIDNEDEE